MRLAVIATASACVLASTPLHAGDAYMKVYAWDPGCEQTVETNNFDLAPGTSVEIEVDLAGCTADQLGGFLFYGYAPRNSSSDGLTRRNNVRLRVTSASGVDVYSDDGHVFTQVETPTRVTLTAENLSLRKPLTVRLVSRSGL